MQTGSKALHTETMPRRIRRATATPSMFPVLAPLKETLTLWTLIAPSRPVRRIRCYVKDIASNAIRRAIKPTDAQVNFGRLKRRNPRKERNQ
jgi:hypothetical protein